MKPTIAEQIAAFEARRVQSAARMAELMELAGTEGATLDAAQQEEFDTLELDIKAIDGHIRRLKLVESQAVANATPVNGENTQQRGTQMRAVDTSPVISIRRNLPPGTAFARYAMAIARSRGNLMQAAELAAGWHDSTPEVETVLRAAVAVGTTTDPTWAGPLVDYQTMAGEFIELLRPATIIGRITGFRNVPFNVKMPAQTTASTAQWVGEGQPKPVSSLGFELISLGFAKVAGIVAMTEELVRFSNPSAEARVRDDLIETIAEFLDHDFVDPAKAEVPNVSPASITNGAPSIAASGTDTAALKADIRALFAKFINSNLSIAGSVWIMDPVMALSISMIQNPLGQAEFPGINMNGGIFMGLPVIVSTNMPNIIILVTPREILMADDGGVTIDVSREASLQMDSAPSGNGHNLVSLWQQNLVALRAERFINWRRRRADAVAYITDANYGAPATSGGGGDGGGSGGEGLTSSRSRSRPPSSSTGA
ncbi:HK97 family phage major capsid protein [Paraburkholderia sp. WSM4175]|uniref:phage major capsid protein n=1 Tax=Paraburkholderia sp. WSM4175 TaxID=2991072 RepID=UPI003D2627A9